MTNPWDFKVGDIIERDGISGVVLAVPPRGPNNENRNAVRYGGVSLLIPSSLEVEFRQGTKRWSQAIVGPEQVRRLHKLEPEAIESYGELLREQRAAAATPWGQPSTPQAEGALSEEKPAKPAPTSRSRKRAARKARSEEEAIGE